MKISNGVITKEFIRQGNQNIEPGVYRHAEKAGGRKLQFDRVDISEEAKLRFDNKNYHKMQEQIHSLRVEKIKGMIEQDAYDFESREKIEGAAENILSMLL